MVNRRFAGFVCAVIAVTTVVRRVTAQRAVAGRFSGQNLSARRLILQAFNIEAREFQLTGGPGWIDSETYDLPCKIGYFSGVIRPARLQVLLQSLLTSRFHFEYQRESRMLPLYVLVLTNSETGIQEVFAFHTMWTPDIGENQQR